MVDVVLAAPVLSNFKGFTELIASVDISVRPYVHPNWIENEGVSKGWNAAIDFGQTADVVVICNDDIVFEPGCLSRLVDAVMGHQYDLVTAINTRDFSVHESAVGHEDEPDFSCFAIDPVIFLSKFGYFDEKFSPAYFEDNDMAYRIKQANGNYVKLLDARMHHAGSVTQNMGGNQVVTSPMFEQNRAYYISKWGGQPGEEKWSTPFNQHGSIKDW